MRSPPFASLKLIQDVEFVGSTKAPLSSKRSKLLSNFLFSAGSNKLPRIFSVLFVSLTLEGDDLHCTLGLDETQDDSD